ncbi:MAG: ABC transporter permease [Ignavibacteriae bacterium]|nr:ABC transporter permease [Ignavibacteriota bacterium]
MNRLLYVIQKEFIQIFRNKAMLPMITILPIIQMILLSFAATNEVKNVKIAIVNHNHSIYSKQLIEKIRISARFILVDLPASIKQSDKLMQEGNADIVLVIPGEFEKKFYRDKFAELQLLVNAINGQQASLGAGYLTAIIQIFNNEIRQEAALNLVVQKVNPTARISIENSYWYNLELNFKHFMIPGILGEIVSMLIMLLTAMNVVREQEIGTIEQINVSPITKWQFILGKMIPFLFIGLFILTVGLTTGKLLFDVPMRGSLLIVFGYSIINLTAVLGLGLFISNISNTQQQALFTTFFFVIIFILMSGLFTPIESMPQWAQYLTIPNPIAQFVYVMRSVLLKGSSFGDVLHNFQATAIMAILFNALAVFSYKKVS